MAGTEREQGGGQTAAAQMPAWFCRPDGQLCRAKEGWTPYQGHLHEEEACRVEAFTHLGLGWKFMPSTLGMVSPVLACPQGRTGYLGSTLPVMLSPTQVDQEHVSWARKPPPAPILPQEVLS